MPAEIVSGLYQLPGVTGVGSFLWQPRAAVERTAESPMLFDCGCPWSGRGLVASLVALGCYPEDLRTIAITHDDVDHVGRLAMLYAVSGATIVAHELEAPRLAQDRWREPPLFTGPARMIAGVLARVYQRAWRHAPVQVTLQVTDGARLPNGWLAVHTPGHTPGHTSYFHPDLRVLIAGDALSHSGGGKLKFPMAVYSEDLAQAALSIRKLAALEPDVVAFGHGPALYNAAGPLRQFADNLPHRP